MCRRIAGIQKQRRKIALAEPGLQQPDAASSATTQVYEESLRSLRDNIAGIINSSARKYYQEDNRLAAPQTIAQAVKLSLKSISR